MRTVQQIYDANYQFAVPPPLPTVTAEAGDGFVRLSWDDVAERGVDPVTGELDFEGYRIYRSTDPEFRDPQVITTGTGTDPIGNGKPIAQFDLVDGIARLLGRRRSRASPTTWATTPASPTPGPTPRSRTASSTTTRSPRTTSAREPTLRSSTRRRTRSRCRARRAAA